jgi:DedD protein
METPARQRIVGAVVLVLLIVLIVPELLRGRAPQSAPISPPRSGAPIGAGDVPLRSVTIDLRDDATSPAAAPTTPAAASVPAPARMLPPGDSTSNVPAAAAIAPAMAPAAASTSAVANSTAMPFAVQVGSFALRVSAERQSRSLQALGYAAFVSPVTRDGRELFRVRVGPMPTRAAASEVYRKLRAAGKDAAIVTN